MEAPPLGRATAAATLRNHSFRRLWIAQFSTVAVIYSLSLSGAALVEEQTHSSTQIGLVILSSILPAFLGSVISGAVVDRFGRKRVLLASHMARALVSLTFWAGTLFLSPSLALVTVYLVNVAVATFTQFATPAELAMLPDLVGSRHLVSANALFQISMLAAEGLGIIVMSPLLIKVFGPPSVGLVGAALCLLGVALVSTLPKYRSPATQPSDGRSSWKDLASDFRAGWLVISQDRLLRLVTIQATLAAALLLVLLSLLPGLLSRHLGLEVADAPILILPGGLGFVLGSIGISRWGNQLSRPATIAIGLLGLGTSVGLLGAASGQSSQLWLILPVILGMGVMLALVIITARVVLQEHPPAEMRGRVIAAQLAMANAVAVLPLLLGGSLADQIGIRPVMGLLGLLAIAAGVVGLRQAHDRKKAGNSDGG
jgi:MFS family permease